MAKTTQGDVPDTYHHIDAPTISDAKYWEEHRKRILVNPNTTPDSYRNAELEYLANARWYYKRKLDGENMRVYWNGDQAIWNGKSNNFVCSADFKDYMDRTFIEEIFEEKFGRDKEVYLFGERMGNKVQGNELGIKDQIFVLFDVKVGNTYLDPENMKMVASYFGIKSVYDFMATPEPKFDTLNHLIDRCCNGEFMSWEGVVCTPTVNIYNHNHGRIVVKIKNKDYNKNYK